ncbi:Insertion element protein [Nonomuraea sp. NN258]|uniref:Insertion element protein n=1 Tax=Nonomuraea antri TaxID=2730852 RepID=UPI00156924FE|nr:Insertion element protein [Nonomuraea antri]NRQ30509.1 Insertion element protein [Nonomuraea antri]
MSSRAVPFHCPYCGDEDLEPYEGAPDAAESSHGGWYCRSCARAFKLKFLGIGVKI